MKDLDGLRSSATSLRASLDEKIVAYTRRRDRLRLQVAPLNAEVERRRALLAKDPQLVALEAAEVKLKNQEQAAFALKECELLVPFPPTPSLFLPFKES